ncbi:MAG: aminopeptidase [bacterium]|nr:aminopeptidase [bacterium]
MDSQYIRKMAKVLLDYSLSVKKDEILVISSTYLAEPLILELYKEALLKGAHPVIKVSLPDSAYYFYKYAQEHQLSFVLPWSKVEVETAHCFLNIMATQNTRALTNVDPEKMRIASLAGKELIEIFEERYKKGELRWSVTLYPTPAQAQDAQMSLQEFEDFVIKACHLDEEDPVEYWRGIDDRQKRIVKFLENKKEFRIIGEDTELVIRTDGRKWVNASGKENFPDGEVFTSPLENGVNGRIRFNLPQYYMGKEVEDVYLEFKDGLVIRANAEKGSDFLQKVLETDDGAKRLGEFAFGLNYGIKNITKNVLFDEKIGGTIHLAIGRAFAEAGGMNKSVVHWDMIYDLRKSGEVYADGELIYKNGEFVVEI